MYSAAVRRKRFKAGTPLWKSQRRRDSRERPACGWRLKSDAMQVCLGKNGTTGRGVKRQEHEPLPIGADAPPFEFGQVSPVLAAMTAAGIRELGERDTGYRRHPICQGVN